jgi:hypothetical protein
MILMARDDSPQRSEEVDGPPAAQCCRTGDRVSTGNDRQLRTSGISMGSLRPRHALPRAQAGPSGPRVEQAEEQAFVHVAAADVAGRANILLRQLGDTDHRGVGKICSLLSSSFSVHNSVLFSNRE